MEKELKNLEQDVRKLLENVKTLEDLQSLETQYLGRKGQLTNILKGIKDLSIEEKKTIGKLSNLVKTALESLFESKKREIEEQALQAELQKTFFDTSVPGKSRPIGSIHPLSLVQEEVERIFEQMGFKIADGPEIESEYFNFEGLNIHSDHPARDMQDTFFIEEKEDKDEGKMVLRTHTSPVQVREMQKHGAPLRLIVPGRVFRNEATDASHDSTFYQVEGLLVGENISLSHLKGVLAEFLTRLFRQKTNVRIRPGYFPFVEPGLEVDFACDLWKDKNSPSSKNNSWLEFMGAGMVHPNVLRAGGIDPEKYQGWAFGFGLTRLVMMRYGIDDIRLLSNGDLRFVKQF